MVIDVCMTSGNGEDVQRSSPLPSSGSAHCRKGLRSGAHSARPQQPLQACSSCLPTFLPKPTLFLFLSTLPCLERPFPYLSSARVLPGLLKCHLAKQPSLIPGVHACTAAELPSAVPLPLAPALSAWHCCFMVPVLCPQLASS